MAKFQNKKTLCAVLASIFVLTIVQTSAEQADHSITSRAFQNASGIIRRLLRKRPQIQLYDNYDLTGPSKSILRGVDVGFCSEACRIDHKCQAFSYEKWDRHCSLKETVGSFRFEPRSTSGIATTSSNPTTSSEPIVMECFAGKHFGGPIYKSLMDSSFDNCQATCENDTDCVAFAHFESRQLCNFFQRTDQILDDEAAVGGVKRQMGSEIEKSGGASCASFSKERIQLEQYAYRSARGDIAKLQAYATSCSICSFLNDARQEIAALQQEQREQDERKAYEEARGNASKLQEYLSLCSICANRSDAREGIAWLKQQADLKQERAAQEAQEDTAYYSAQGNIDRLKNYLQTCRVCSHSVESQNDLTNLEREANLFTFRVCNQSQHRAWIAMSGRKDPASPQWSIAGWWEVKPTDCKDLGRFVRTHFYYMAMFDNHSVGWRGNFPLCVPYTKFERTNYGGKCKPTERQERFFDWVVAEPIFTWTLTQ